jgi:hypothetical protein
MAPEDTTEEDPIIALGNALSLVRHAIRIAKKGLLMNPSTKEERELNETLVELDIKRAEVRAKLDALIAGSSTIVGPTTAQVKEISDLTAEVGKLTNDSITASGAVALTSKVLALATEVASGS